jgi:hypothetical protein
MAAVGSRVSVTVKNTFLVAEEIDDFEDDSCVSRGRSRSYSDSEIEYSGFQKGKCEMGWDSSASTSAYETDEEPVETIPSDDDDELPSGKAIQPPPGNWVPPVQQTQFTPVCVAVVPFVVVNQPVWPQKSSRSARRRRARAMNRWYRYNAMASEEHQLPENDDDCADDFDCEFQFSEDDVSASLNLDEADCWPDTAVPDQSEKICK